MKDKIKEILRTITPIGTVLDGVADEIIKLKETKNTDEEKGLFDSIIKDVKGTDRGYSVGKISYDPWCGGDEANKFGLLENHIIDKGRNSIIYENETYVVILENGSSSQFIDSPDKIIVTVLNPLFINKP